MSKNVVVNLIFLILSNLLIYFILEDYIFSLIFILISVLYFIICYLNDKKYTSKITKFEECCKFIEAILVNFKTSNSFISCYEKSKKVLSKNTLNHIKNNDNVLESLNIYYKFNIFSIFKNIIEIYSSVGGDISSYSNSLLKECRRLQNISCIYKKDDDLYMFSYFSMWCFAFLILVVSKFSINSTMFNFNQGILFKIIILLGFVLFLTSTYIFYVGIYKTIYIKEQKNEKNI